MAVKRQLRSGTCVCVRYACFGSGPRGDHGWHPRDRPWPNPRRSARRSAPCPPQEPACCCRSGAASRSWTSVQAVGIQRAARIDRTHCPSEESPPCGWDTAPGIWEEKAYELVAAIGGKDLSQRSREERGEASLPSPETPRPKVPQGLIVRLALMVVRMP